MQSSIQPILSLINMMNIITKITLKNIIWIFSKQNFTLLLKDPDFYPEKRDYKTFNEWFETHACDTVFDLGNEPIEIEEF